MKQISRKDTDGVYRVLYYIQKHKSTINKIMVISEMRNKKKAEFLRQERMDCGSWKRHYLKVCVYFVCVYVGMGAIVHLWMLKDNLWELFLSFHWVGSGDLNSDNQS